MIRERKAWKSPCIDVGWEILRGDKPQMPGK
jgi:hypothetical protein